MNIVKIFIISLVTFCSSVIYAQEFNIDDQYSQAMQNAKTAFEANQYSQAVMFYREALSIKPEALLPKYKIEDIRTIYIKNELEVLQNNTPIASTKPTNKKKRKVLEAKEEELVQKAEKIATEKMYQEADLAKEELAEISSEAEKLEIDDVDIEIEEEQIQNTVADRETKMEQIKTKDASKVDGTGIKQDAQLTVSMREIPLVEQPKEIQEPVLVDEPEVVEVKTEPVVIKPAKPEPKKEVVKDEAWIKAENIRLANKYPNKKTVEEIDKPGKHITRVVMNINGKVNTFLKVHHSWGATFFFVDEIGLELRSISQTHFNRMTDLSTYDKN